MIFTRTLIAWLALIILTPIIFISIQISLFMLAGSLVDWWFLNNNPDWYEGPFGGIHQVPVFLVLIPFSLWCTAILWRKVKQSDFLGIGAKPQA